MEKLGIIIVIESGDLEQKSKLLINSIRAFGGAAKDSKIWAVKPRKGKALGDETLRFLRDKKVEFIDINLNKQWYLYGLANKIYASAYIEEHFGDQYETLLFLDSDTIVINSIDINILEGKYAVAVKPIDGQYLALRKGDKVRGFWKNIYESCEFPVENIWTVKTTVDQTEILAYFNSGVIFTASKNRLFSEWLINFERFIKQINAYHLPPMEYYFLEQALLSGTILKRFPKDQVKILNSDHNYCLNFKDKLEEIGKGNYHNIKIIHYHYLFQENWQQNISFLPHHVLDWLKQYRPLKSYKDGPLKRYYKIFCYIKWRFKNILMLLLERNYK